MEKHIQNQMTGGKSNCWTIPLQGKINKAIEA